MKSEELKLEDLKGISLKVVSHKGIALDPKITLADLPESVLAAGTASHHELSYRDLPHRKSLPRLHVEIATKPYNDLNIISEKVYNVLANITDRLTESVAVVVTEKRYERAEELIGVLSELRTFAEDGLFTYNFNHLTGLFVFKNKSSGYLSIDMGSWIMPNELEIIRVVP